MSEEKEFDVVLHALQQHRDKLWKMTQQNMNSEFIGMNIMDDIRLRQIDELDEAIKARATPPQRTEQEPVGDEWTPCMKLPVVVYVRKQRLGESHVSTREGITPVKPDDLIMRGVSGEEYPIGRAIFEQTYSLNTTPPQRTEQNFCSRCGKRTKDIHTCTPPMEMNT